MRSVRLKHQWHATMKKKNRNKNNKNNNINTISTATMHAKWILNPKIYERSHFIPEWSAWYIVNSVGVEYNTRFKEYMARIWKFSG